ncbi:ECF transporter S component [Levilactobacillus huananensis]|uniref:ECF transporter S component n=1 Tax=Levilactobacillus huananensis TaxID=2486019 RepID=UPI0013DDEBF2|nr:ECF transporter S component [Levilactobacillus huananensis]
MILKKYTTQLSILSLLIIPLGVAVNFVGGQMATVLKLPFYLDAIGTLFSALLCGPWVAVLTGALTNIFMSLSNPTNLPFIIVNIFTGVVAGLLAKANFFSNWWKWLLSMLILALVAILTSVPIVVLVYGGVTGGGTSIITAVAMASGTNIWTAVFGTEGIFTLLDRVISFVICWLVIRVMPARLLIRFDFGENYIKWGTTRLKG